MGNVNAREGVCSDSLKQGIAAPVEAHGVSVSPSDLMGQTPPHSPRATQSPLMFTPQAPVVPLQRPGEKYGSSHSWMRTASGYEGMCSEQGIPIMITWSYDGKEVAVEGSWDNWRTRIHLQRSGKDFIIMKVLPSGVYQYRFVVDGQWRHAPDLPWAQDEAGNAYNVLDLQEYVPEDIESISSFEPPQSPESSYNSLPLGSEDFEKEPPLVPPHLQMTLLNVPASNMEILPPLSRPQHVVLNHLYMQKRKSGPSVVALGTTHRFLAKYVTVVLYKSCSGNFGRSIRSNQTIALHLICNCLMTTDPRIYYLFVLVWAAEMAESAIFPPVCVSVAIQSCVQHYQLPAVTNITKWLEHPISYGQLKQVKRWKIRSI